MLSIVAAVVMLGILILVHELGHFAAAKLTGIGVERFSIGFGRRLAGRTVGGTEYRLSVFPLGGYVKMVGDDPQEPVDDPRRSFLARSVPVRMAVVLAGPLTNLLLAVLVFATFFMVLGLHEITGAVGKVTPGMPADQAGLRPGDRITAVGGRTLDGWEELTTVIHGSAGRELELTVRRGGEEFRVRVTPKPSVLKNEFNEDVPLGLIGIEPETSVRHPNPLQAVWLGVLRTVDYIVLTFTAIAKIFQGTVPADTVGGPILMVQMAGEQAREGLLNLIFLMAILSINLAVFNLLPIPILDGGHILLFAVEAIRRRPVSLRRREIIQQVGLLIIAAIFLFAFYNDINRLVASFLARFASP